MTKLMVVFRSVATAPKYMLRVSTFVYRLNSDQHKKAHVWTRLLMYRNTALFKEALCKIIVIPCTLSYLPVYSVQTVVPF